MTEGRSRALASEAPAACPQVTVVVPSHARPARLVTLLDALAGQTLDRSRWKLVVVHDYPPAEAARILDGHPLALDGMLRQIAIEPGSGSPARQRNVGWRTASSALIAFVDDDCRPVPRWLESLVDAALARPGAIVQGRTQPDPREAEHLRGANVRTVRVDPPGPYGQTCNIIYERPLLERLGGFDERALTAEDIDLMRRGRRAGAGYIGEPSALVYHAVEPMTVRGMIRHNRRWEWIVYVVKRHPEMRQGIPLGIFWTAYHAYALGAAVGLVGALRRPALALLCLPYLRLESRRHGPSLAGRLLALSQVPARMPVELAEMLHFARASVRHRTLLL